MIRLLTIRLTTILFLLATTSAWAEEAEDAGARSPAPENARVYFITPADGDTLSGPVTVRFGLHGLGVAPAGVEKASTGHHHLIIDAPLPDLQYAVPKSDHYRHFGGGQTEVTLDLAPGSHSLQLLMGDHNHVPHAPTVASEVITITLE